MRAELIGTTIADGRWSIVECLRGGLDRGMYRAIGAGASTALVTIGPAQQVGHDELTSRLALVVDGVTPLLAITSVHVAGRRDVLVEAEPPGASVTVHRVEDRIAVARQLAAIVARAHAAGIVLGGLRPELVYSDGRTCTGVAPRAEPFLATSRPPDHGVPPCFEDFYLSPEALALAPPSTASDVFSLCATLAFVLDDSPPFPGATVMARLAAAMRGAHRPLGVAPLIGQGLTVDPKARPTADAIAAALA